VIRASAHAALGESRQVIGLLRDHEDDRGANGVTEAKRPLPTLKDLAQLVEESRAAGMRVAFDLRLEHPEAVPDSTARAAYRVVQEGLTNARKHAPASAVEVEVARDGDSALTVSVLRSPPINGSGAGLLRERRARRAAAVAPRHRHRRDRPRRAGATASGS
jgi:signal transduction histidine kinase